MANSSEKSSIGMPQLDFSNFDNQTFWLFLFLILFLGVIFNLKITNFKKVKEIRNKVKDSSTKNN